jgi:hypothetical protein
LAPASDYGEVVELLRVENLEEDNGILLPSFLLPSYEVNRLLLPGTPKALELVDHRLKPPKL